MRNASSALGNTDPPNTDPANTDPVATDLRDDTGVAARIARETVSSRQLEYAAEVEGLLAAGMAVMRRLGTSASPRVADVVKEAGVSNGVFYRHFQSKDELVYALLEHGTARLRSHLVRRMAEVDDPAAKVRRWVEAILATATRPELAEEVRAALWNGARMRDDSRRRVTARNALAGPLHDTVRRLGSLDPAGDSLLVAHTVLGRLEDFLWRREAPTPDDVDRLVAFCLRAATLRDPSPEGQPEAHRPGSATDGEVQP
jgi:AcrR family transcriptional regulator